MGGFNDQGVAITEMAVEGEPPRDPGRPDIIAALLLRVVLDYAGDVDEALALFGRFNVHFAAVPCHFLICDATGKSVVLEFLDGKATVVEPRQTWQVSTNHVLFGKSEAENDRACGRYRVASDWCEEKRNAEMRGQDILGVMNRVAVDGGWVKRGRAARVSSRVDVCAVGRHHYMARLRVLLAGDADLQHVLPRGQHGTLVDQRLVLTLG